MVEQAPLVRLDGVTKAYPGVLANDAVSLELRAGEVHALLGETGAGKSTLMGVLYGLLRPDAGRIVVDAEEVAIGEPRDAMALGIGFVQQHFSLIPTLTVAENLVLALRFGGHRIGLRESVATVRELSARYGLGVEPDVVVEQLSVGAQQRAELLKALARSPRVLILDEPSSLLSPQEVERLGEVIRQLAAEGIGVILISHKLDEVLAVVDRITVLRRGRLVRTLDRADATRELLGRLMIGDLASTAGEGRAERRAPGEPLVEVTGLAVEGDRGEVAVDGVSLIVRRGEILGLAGLEGSGQVELVEALAGVRPSVRGAIRLDGRDVGALGVAERQRLGVGHIPADRRRAGLVGDLSVAENLLLPSIRERRFSRLGVVRRGAVREHAGELIERFGVRTSGAEVPVATLSGGNQQKVVVARELARHPSVVLSCYPTWGLDFSAAAGVHAELERQRDAGAAVLLASMDLDELLAVADRIVVMQGGRITGELPAHEATAEEIGLLMGGAAG
jgi:general nucleoside transport system ATP-binding protein